MLRRGALCFIYATTVPWYIGAALSAQTPPRPTFEVVSIKLNASGSSGTIVDVKPGGVFTATNVSIRILVQRAYGLRNVQIDGGPSWVGADQFDIIAKPTAGESAPLQPMLQSLLAERFNFAAHMEMRELPVFLLVKARSDGRLGPWIRPTAGECAAPTSPLSSPRVGELPRCMTIAGLGRYAAGNRPIAALGRFVEGQVDRVVLDRTGLIGNFDLNLEFAPNQLTPSADSDRPSIVTALQEQLGLKLDSTKAPVNVLVIDHVEHPTEN